MERLEHLKVSSWIGREESELMHQFLMFIFEVYSSCLQSTKRLPENVERFVEILHQSLLASTRDFNCWFTTRFTARSCWKKKTFHKHTHKTFDRFKFESKLQPKTKEKIFHYIADGSPLESRLNLGGESAATMLLVSLRTTLNFKAIPRRPQVVNDCSRERWRKQSARSSWRRTLNWNF